MRKEWWFIMLDKTGYKNQRMWNKQSGRYINFVVGCNKCMWEGEEEDLVMFEDEDGFGKGCPKCETDAYLMGLEDVTETEVL